MDYKGIIKNKYIHKNKDKYQEHYDNLKIEIMSNINLNTDKIKKFDNAKSL